MFSFHVFDHPMSRGFQNRFSTQYRCYSVSMLAGPNDRSDVEKGGKIIMPPSALDQLSRLNITYPMLFKLTNKNSDRMTHCGVLEFVADEGICYLPHWMMQNLLLEEGGLVQVESVNLMVATYSKFQPQSPDFLDITNPKAVLENALRNFACLTTGDVVAINYNEKIYELRVMETKPDKAVSIIECDMNVRSSTLSQTTVSYSVVLHLKCVVTLFLRWILMLPWVTKSLNDDLSTRKNQQRKKQIPPVTKTWTWDSELSLALAIVWMVKQKGLSPAPPLLAQVTSKEVFPTTNSKLAGSPSSETRGLCPGKL
ncbi:ubiquitin recognition factor in ER-associated degradation protein 1 isoform X1 [Etheostoma spectabile]|uniref:ubiquitin recognition factor in ER-associated degradation protein 1 isoform X1 n=1 Tax=Etheostoma spectabile TaxID=54343 RepID=UPI0013AF20F5|nr:ubiquitin recognition factor in ER-associated degradation protein 1 isoform X1 [Etheostoma spectabile]